MNNQRRKRLLDALQKIDEAKDIISEVMEEEQEAFDNLPESFQEGERGEAMQEAIDTMQRVLDSLDEADEIDAII